MDLTEKSELNDPQVWLISGNSYRKTGQDYHQFTSSFGEGSLCMDVIFHKVQSESLFP